MKAVVGSQQFLSAKWIHMGREDQVGALREEALQDGPPEGGAHYPLVGPAFWVPLALVLGGLDLGASWDLASTSSAAAACSRIAVGRSSATRARAARHRPSDSMPTVSIA